MATVISRLRFWLCRTVAVSTLAISGCATVADPLPDPPEDVAAIRAEREEQVIEDFQQTRADALYQAALARWREGDVVASEAMLVRLLQQSDEHHEARLMVADLYVSTGKPKAAERHLRLLIERNADDAQAHHSLGMLLDTTGKAEEALHHLQKAAELAPDNELYAISHATAQADSNTPPERG